MEALALFPPIFRLSCHELDPWTIHQLLPRESKVGCQCTVYYGRTRSVDRRFASRSNNRRVASYCDLTTRLSSRGIASARFPLAVYWFQ